MEDNLKIMQSRWGWLYLIELPCISPIQSLVPYRAISVKRVHKLLHLIGFARKNRTHIWNCFKSRYHLLVCVNQIYEFSDQLEHILIAIKATKYFLAFPCGQIFCLQICVLCKRAASQQGFKTADNKLNRVRWAGILSKKC